MKVRFRKGPARPAKPVQFANSWISVDYTDERGGHGIVNPAQVTLETEDEVRMFASANRAVVGNFWRMWRLKQDGTFTAQNPAPLRRRQFR